MTGLLAGFESEPALREALEHFSGWRELETFVAFFLLMTYADVGAYPLNIGGRPNFAWPTFIPIAFELGVLCAMLSGFLGFFILCRLPRLHDPIDECASLKGASRDGWFLAIRVDAPHRLEEARRLLAALRPLSLEEFAA
jgi:hypothetical protein